MGGLTPNHFAPPGEQGGSHDGQHLVEAVLLCDRSGGVTPIILHVGVSAAAKQEQSTRLTPVLAGHIERRHALAIGVVHVSLSL